MVALRDNNEASWTQVVDVVEFMADVTRIPILLDGDTGYGNAINARRTVHDYAQAGAAGIMIEDQVSPKRCGHTRGKQVVSRGEAKMRIRAAVDERADHDILIMARTDALAVEGLELALERAEKYLACGVDALFVEALRTTEQMALACSRFAARVPMLANMVEGGKTPIMSAQELGQQGFRIVIFPGGTIRAVAHNLQGYFNSLKDHQSTRPWKDRMLDFEQLNSVLGTPDLIESGRRYEFD